MVCSFTGPITYRVLACLNLCIDLRCLIINTYRGILIFVHVWAITGVIDWSAAEKLRNHFSTPNILLMLEIEGSAALSTREIFTSSWCVHQRLFHVKHCKYTSYLTLTEKPCFVAYRCHRLIPELIAEGMWHKREVPKRGIWDSCIQQHLSHDPIQLSLILVDDFLVEIVCNVSRETIDAEFNNLDHGYWSTCERIRH